jgi:hypothetical protein
MEVARRRHPEAALERRAEVGDDVAEQVVGHDHLELPRLEHHVHRERIDVVVRGDDPGVGRRELSEDPLPERVSGGHRIALVGHAEPRQAARLREVEGVPDDPVHALPGVDFLLNRDFVLGPRLEAAADVDIQAFGVLAKNREVDVRRRSPLQRAEPRVEQADRPVVDIQIELEAGAEQDVAGVAVVGHARIAEGADQHGVELPQQLVAVRRQRDAGLQIVIGPPGQVFEVQRQAKASRGGGQHRNRCRGHLPPDAVPRNDADVHSSSHNPLARVRSPR